MAETTASGDGRFTRDGHGLGHWLRELVGDDMGRRDRAAEVLGRMHLDFPDDPAELDKLDGTAHQEEYFAAIRRTLAGPDFDARAYVDRLIVFMRDAQALRMGLYERESARQNRVLDRLLGRLGPEPSPEGLGAVGPRLLRAMCAACDPKNTSEDLQGRLLNQQVTAAIVFGALGDQLLLVPDRLRDMLRDRHERYKAAEALARIGPAAVGFAPELLGLLDAVGESDRFDAPRALAAVIRDDPALIRTVVDRLPGPPGVARGAADTLGDLGPAARQVPGCVDALLVMTGHADRRWAAIAALGRVTTGTDVAVDRLLALSRDPEMWVRGVALTALGDVARQPWRVVPRLIEAFDDYEEQDPDWTHRSAHERVVDALRAFGADAAPAVPALTSRVRDPDGELDRGVVETLGAIGPAAGAALPVLRQLALDRRYTEDDLRNPLDPLAAALVRIGGG